MDDGDADDDSRATEEEKLSFPFLSFLTLGNMKPFPSDMQINRSFLSETSLSPYDDDGDQGRIMGGDTPAAPCQRPMISRYIDTKNLIADEDDETRWNELFDAINRNQKIGEYG